MAEKKEQVKEKIVETNDSAKENISKKPDTKKYPTLQLKTERDIAMDFAEKVYQKFDKMIKSIVLFGSQAKHTAVSGSDIDIIIILDDASIKFDEQLTFWYREELGKIVSANPYKSELHINTVKLTTWWNDLTKGDPTVINILRYGETLIDLGGFFNPLKILLDQGKIRPTPESIYNALNRVPGHIRNSKFAEISSIEGCYWAFVDCAQALLMAIRVLPPSPEHISILLRENFVDKKLLDGKHITNFIEVYDMHKKVMHGAINDIDGKLIDSYQNKAEDFFKATIKLIDDII